MTINAIISQHLNNLKPKLLRAWPWSSSGPSKDGIHVEYYMSIPHWYKNSDWVNEVNKYIKYDKPDHTVITFNEHCLNNIYHIDRFNRNKRKKAFIKVDYNIDDIIKMKDITHYFNEERKRVFSKLKEQILLEKIGELSRDWEEITGGKTNYDKLKYRDGQRNLSSVLSDCSCSNCFADVTSEPEHIGVTNIISNNF